MNERLISVIVAAYNVEKYLDRCVKSLVEQTYPCLEIVLVDDGSTDSTSVICDEWARQDDRIVVIHKKNGGPSDARNAGIKRARGKWLGFVDGDDYVSTTMYEHLYQHRIERGITVCGYQTEENGNLYSCPGVDKNLQQREAVDLYMANEFRALCNGEFTYWGSYAWNKLYDCSLFTDVSYPKGKKYEDMYIIFDLISQASSIQFIPDCEYIYVQHFGSITHEVNIIHDSLQARVHQKEQLSKYWHIEDARIEQLIACEYFFILYRYASLSPEERKQYQATAEKVWEKLCEEGYDFFPIKMKVKLFLFVYFPNIFNLLRKWKLNTKGY